MADKPADTVTVDKLQSGPGARGRAIPPALQHGPGTCPGDHLSGAFPGTQHRRFSADRIALVVDVEDLTAAVTDPHAVGWVKDSGGQWWGNLARPWGESRRRREWWAPARPHPMAGWIPVRQNRVRGREQGG